MATGATVDVDRGRLDDLTTYRWSPDSRWLAYMKQPAATRLSAIWVYSVEEGKTQQLTSGNAADSEPVFDPKGRYLYFLSNRDFRLTFSGFEFNYVYTDPTRVYVGVLSKTGPALFLPQSDEEPQRADEALRQPAPPGRRSRACRSRRLQTRKNRTQPGRRRRRRSRTRCQTRGGDTAGSAGEEAGRAVHRP